MANATKSLQELVDEIHEGLQNATINLNKLSRSFGANKTGVGTVVNNKRLILSLSKLQDRQNSGRSKIKPIGSAKTIASEWYDDAITASEDYEGIYPETDENFSHVLRPSGGRRRRSKRLRKKGRRTMKTMKK